jgi:PKD repeat protein
MLFAITCVLVIAACAPRNLPSRSPAPAIKASAASGNYFDYVVVIVMENHAICDIVTYCGGAAPYETELANASGLATNYHACEGHSLADYLCLTGASTFGCMSNPDPNSDACTRLAWDSPSIVDRLADAGLTWKAYVENMTSDCRSPAGNGYAVRHNPFVYYGSVVTNATRCARVVPAGTDDSALVADLASASSASNYMWLTPNLCNDMDYCPLAVGDAYLSVLVPKILQSTVFTTERAALFITFDDAAAGKGAPNLYTVWSGPVAKAGYTSAVSYNHFSLLSTLEVNWNLAPLNANDSEAANMTEFFTGAAPDFSLSAYPWSVSFLEGGSATSTIGLQAHNGFNGIVALTASSSPSGVTADCSPASIQGSETSNCTLAGSAAGSFRVTVAGSNGSLVNTVSIGVQVIAPLAARFTFSPASPFAGRPVQFSGWATGGLSAYDYAWAFGDGKTGSDPRPSHVFSANGTYSVALTIHDASGQNASVNQAVGVARSTPSVTTGVASQVNDVRATLNGDLQSLGEAGDVLVGFLYGTDPNLIDAANWTAGQAFAPRIYSGQVTGLNVNTTYYFEAWAMGSGFATGGISSFVTTASPPPLAVPSATLQVQGTLGRNGWYVSDVTIALTAWAPRGLPTWTNVAVDGGGWINYSAPFSLHDGRHTLEYYAFLGINGLAEKHRFANISVDTTPPELSVQDSAEIVTRSSVTITWTASDGGSGIEGYEVQVDGGSFQAVGTSTSVTFNLQDGAHTITVRVTDVAGNAKAQTKAFVINTNPFSPSGPYSGLPLYLILFAVALAVVLLLLRRQRRRQRTPPGPQGPRSTPRT